MAGASLKFWKVFTNISNTKNVLTNKCLLPAQQSIASVKQSADKSSILPEKPKRPGTAYLSFYQSVFQKLSSQNPGSAVKDIARLASQEWKTCDPSVKSLHEENYKKNWAEYVSAKENFEAKLTPAMKEELIASTERAKIEQLKKKQKKAQKELGKPKKPQTPWTLFVKSKVADKGDKSFVNWMKELSKEWYTIDTNTKTKLGAEYQLALNKYHEDLEMWEENMIREGRADIVRRKSQIKKPKIKNVKVVKIVKKSSKAVKDAKK